MYTIRRARRGRVWPMAVAAGSKLRAALEAQNLGYRYFTILGMRNLSQTIEDRSSSTAGAQKESDFNFAPGHYGNDVEIVLEVTVKLLDKAGSNEPPPSGAESVATILTAAGITPGGPVAAGGSAAAKNPAR